MDGREITHQTVDELLSLLANGMPPDLLERIGGLERLARADAIEIASHLKPQRCRKARDAANVVAAAFELGRRVELARSESPMKMTSAEDVAGWARPRLTMLSHEELWLLGLDGRSQLRAARCVAKGSIHGAAVRAADPLRFALRLDVSAFVLVHNHPSGDPTPSREDEHFTQVLAASAEIVGLTLLDHVVVAREGFACVTFNGSRPRATHSERTSRRTNASR